MVAGLVVAVKTAAVVFALKFAGTVLLTAALCVVFVGACLYAVGDL